MASVKTLANGADIPDDDHVVRYCGFQHVVDGRIAESAFGLKQNEEYVSVNWVEHFNQKTMDLCLQDLRSSIETHGALNIGSRGKFAKIHVAQAKSAINGLRITYIPLENSPSHAGIHPPNGNNREYELDLANLIQDEDIFPAKL